jgi:hypothetical protein
MRAFIWKIENPAGWPGGPRAIYLCYALGDRDGPSDQSRAPGTSQVPALSGQHLSSSISEPPTRCHRRPNFRCTARPRSRAHLRCAEIALIGSISFSHRKRSSSPLKSRCPTIDQVVPALPTPPACRILAVHQPTPPCCRWCHARQYRSCRRR